MIDKWKEVKGYDKKYLISDHGNLIDPDFNGKFKVYVFNTDKNNYVYAGLLKNGKRVNVAIHRLVAETFIPNPNGYKEINHKDEIKYHNSVGNLEWCTRSYNVKYSAYKRKKKEKLLTDNRFIRSQIYLHGLEKKQELIAEHLNLSVEKFKRKMNKKSFNENEINMLAKYFNCTTDYLLQGK